MWFMWQLFPLGFHDPGLLEVSSFVPPVESPQLVCHCEAFQSQDGLVTFLGPIALKCINVVPEHEDNEVLQCLLIRYPGIVTCTKHFSPVIPVVPCCFVQSLDTAVLYMDQGFKAVTKIKMFKLQALPRQN